MSKTKPPGTNKPNELTRLFAEFAGNAPDTALVIHQPFLKLCKGDHLAALLLSQIIYWQGKTTDPDGWFSHSYEEWHAELYLSQYQVSRLVRGETNEKRKRKSDVFTLQSVGVETKRRRSRYHKGAATIHYRVNWHALGLALRECFTEDEAPPVVNIVDNERVTDINNVDNDDVNIVNNNVVDNASNVYKDYPETTTKKKKAASAARTKTSKPKAEKPDTDKSERVAKKDALFDEIIRVFKYDPKRLTRSESSSTAKAAWELLDAGYRPEHMRIIHGYLSRTRTKYNPAYMVYDASAAIADFKERYGYDPITTVLEVDAAAEGTPPQPDEDAPVDESTLIDATAAFEELGRAISGNRIAAAGKR